MTTTVKIGQSLWRSLAVACLAVGAVTFASPGFAGECPAGKMVAEGKGQQPGATAPRDVTDTLLGSIDLAGEAVMLEGRDLRLRRLVIQPGGEVPWHSHGDRPAIIYVVEGEVTEYSSTCAVPILHKAGEVSIESQGLSHWWKNTGKTPVVLISADILHDPNDAHSM